MTEKSSNQANNSPEHEEDRELLRVEDLSVAFPHPAGDEKKVVKNVSFSLKEGEILGIAGESGSGKSMTALAVMGLLPENAIRRCGRICFDGQTICES